ncbi:hypothetical protein DFH27DRAFT_567168 [Peziza echinospora]|nr:hypothetical protein DFH27DRAFT_567168 [Peziza echinospora]
MYHLACVASVLLLHCMHSTQPSLRLPDVVDLHNAPYLCTNRALYSAPQLTLSNWPDQAFFCPHNHARTHTRVIHSRTGRPWS